MPFHDTLHPLSLKGWPFLDKVAEHSVMRVLRRGILSEDGAPEVNALELELSRYLDGLYVVGVSSGTNALILSLLAAELPIGSEVIVPAYTFGASALGVIHAGLIPRFATCDPNTFNLTPESLEQAITANTRAVMAVHMHGLPCDMEGILKIADKYNLFLVEDCAQALGARYLDRPVGGWGNCGCFSLQSSKHIGVGEGGFIATSSRLLANTVRSLKEFGFSLQREGNSEDRNYRTDYTVFREHYLCGGSFRLPEIPAALARVQLKELPSRMNKLSEYAEIMSHTLVDVPNILLPAFGKSGYKHAWHKIRIGVAGKLSSEVDSKRTAYREQMRQALHKAGLETTLWQMPILPLQNAFMVFAKNDPCWVKTQIHDAVERSFMLFHEKRPLIAQDKPTVIRVFQRLKHVWLHRSEHIE